MRHIHISEVDGKPEVCFDTGLDPRSFARTKMSQCLTEPGYIVYQDGSCKEWRATGVNEVDGFMRVWGSPFYGERLDQLLNETPSSEMQTSLQAVAFWIRAKLLLGEKRSTLSPGAIFICCADGGSVFPRGSVFFAPENLSQRCLFIEGIEPNYFNCPDLNGIEAAAFCAGAMLYKVLTQTQPYSSTAGAFQDMREGVFLPPSLAALGLDEKLCSLIQSALLLPVEKKGTNKSGADILSDLLNILIDKDNNIVSVSSLFRALNAEESAQLEKEKKYYIKKKNITVKINRFVMRNKPALVGIAAGLIFVIFVTANIIKSRSELSTTVGMTSLAVVDSYYRAFNSMDHVLMEACLSGVDKSDVNMVVNLYVVNKIRQSHEFGNESFIIPAETWRQQGGELPAHDVFGITDLSIEYLGGSEESGMVFYRVNYMLWFPYDEPVSRRIDELTLSRKGKRWRITDIHRTQY